MITSPVKTFYDDLQFPGHYASLDCYANEIANPYLRLIDHAISLYPSADVLDVGCGTGLIANLIASRHRDCKVTAIDFADGIHHGQRYSTQHSLNVDWIKHDWLEVDLTKQYDVIVCQGVLHHVPDWSNALAKIQQACRPDGAVVIGLYHPWGKILKKYFRIDYASDILTKDQENNPFELSFGYQQVKDMFSEWQLMDYYPSVPGWAAPLAALVNSRNGGLITYLWRKNESI